MSTPTPEGMDRLAERVGNGMAWLSEHDPKGNFYAWFQAGLTPASVMPAQDDGTKEAYTEWYRAKLVYDRLETQLSRLENRGYKGLTWPIGWKPASEVRR